MFILYLFNNVCVCAVWVERISVSFRRTTLYWLHSKYIYNIIYTVLVYYTTTYNSIQYRCAVLAITIQPIPNPINGLLPRMQYSYYIYLRTYYYIKLIFFILFYFFQSRIICLYILIASCTYNIPFIYYYYAVYIVIN